MSSLLHLVFLKLSSHFTKAPFTQGRWRPGVLFCSFGRFVSSNTFLRADSIHPRRCAFAPTIRLFLVNTEAPFAWESVDFGCHISMISMVKYLRPRTLPSRAATFSNARSDVPSTPPCVSRRPLNPVFMRLGFGSSVLIEAGAHLLHTQCGLVDSGF